MKKLIPFLPNTLCVALVLLVVSCSKSGDAGPAGQTGPAGPAGPAGGPGPTGTANVIYSTWIDTTTWEADTIITGTIIDTIGYFANITAPKLDLEMLNKGEIKVYVNGRDATDPLVFPLPFLSSGLYIDVAFSLNTIELYSNGDLTGFPFRYILIPGGTAARSAKSIDWNNYKEVQKYLGLKD